MQSTHSADDDGFSKHQLLASLQDWNTWRYMVIYVGIVTCVSSYSIFLPTIVHAMGFQALQAQLLTVPPYVLGCLSVVVSEITNGLGGCLFLLLLSCRFLHGTLTASCSEATSSG